MAIRDLIPWSRQENRLPSSIGAEQRDRDDHPILSLHREVNRLFDDVFRGFGAPWRSLRGGAADGRTAGWVEGAGVISMIAVCLGLTYAAMRAAERLVVLLGVTGGRRAADIRRAAVRARNAVHLQRARTRAIPDPRSVSDLR